MPVQTRPHLTGRHKRDQVCPSGVPLDRNVGPPHLGRSVSVAARASRFPMPVGESPRVPDREGTEGAAVEHFHDIRLADGLVADARGYRAAAEQVARMGQVDEPSLLPDERDGVARGKIRGVSLPGGTARSHLRRPSTPRYRGSPGAVSGRLRPAPRLEALLRSYCGRSPRCTRDRSPGPRGAVRPETSAASAENDVWL